MPRFAKIQKEEMSILQGAPGAEDVAGKVEERLKGNQTRKKKNPFS